MQTTMEEAGRHTVRLTIEVPPDEVAKDLGRIYRAIGQQLRVPGFRKGKVPARIIDAHVGREVVLEEFVHEIVPEYFREAVREHELAPIAEPEVDVEPESIDEHKPLVISATVEVRPRLVIEDWREIVQKVEPPEAEVTEADVDEYIDRLRERFAEVETVSRPAQRGDYVLADIRATLHGEDVPEASLNDHLYEVGSGDIVPALDEEVENARSGQILKFNAQLPERFGERAGQEVTFQVLVKEVKAKRLPAADDEFAKTASEFDTIDELRADLREKLGDVVRDRARGQMRDLVLQELVSHVDVDLPDRLVDHETDHRIEDAEHRAERAGVTLEQLLEAQGWDELRFRSDARAHATRAIRSDLVLEAIARQEGLTVTPEEMGRAVAELSGAIGRPPKEVVRTLERSGQVTSLAGDIIRSKALDLLVETAQGAGQAIEEGEDASTGTPPEPPADDEGARE